jgi:hypothetical protein
MTHHNQTKKLALDFLEYDILGMYQDWNTELVAQFYGTAWRSDNGYDSTLNFAVEGHWLELKITELPTIFAFADNDFHCP